MNERHIPIGQQLIEASKKQSLSRDDILSILKIRAHTLDIIEKDQYPSQEIDVFLKGHIVAYCRLLKITPQTILNQLEAKGYDFSKPKKTKQPVHKKHKKYWLLFIPFVILLFLISSEPRTQKKHKIVQPLSLEYQYEQ